MAYYPKWLNLLFSTSNNLGTTPFCHVRCLGMHSNVMHRFMVQAFQDPPLCSSTENSTFTTCIAWYSYRCLMLILFLFHYGSRRFHIVKCTVQGQTQCYVWNFVGIFTSNISFIVVQRTSVSTFRSYLKVEWTVWEKTKMNFL
jgi:hypothetical protein